MRESPPSWPNAPTCLWLRWCILESSPDGPLAPSPAAARAGVEIVDVTGGDSDDSDGSPLRPSRGLGLKTTGLELGDSSPNFSPNNSPESPTDNEVSKYSFFARLMHYMDGNKISEANRAAVEVCILVEAGAAVRSMDPTKKEKKEMAFFNKYMGIDRNCNVLPIEYDLLIVMFVNINITITIIFF
jgi:hypothetical protein